jgi:hypothetical protein
MFKLINQLIVGNNGFGLRSWNDRYGKGVWVCIAPNSYMLEAIESATDAGDLDMEPATDYLLMHKAEWLPFVVANDFVDGLNKLEARLAALPESELKRSSAWSDAVTKVIEHLNEVNESTNEYGGMEGKFKTISSDFKQIFE